MIDVKITTKQTVNGVIIVDVKYSGRASKAQGSLNKVIPDLQNVVAKTGIDSIDFREFVHDKVRSNLQTLDAITLNFSILSPTEEFVESV